MRILNFGSLNIDYVYQVEHILCPGETLSSNGMEVFPGGKGLNQSIAMARAVPKTAFFFMAAETEGLQKNMCSRCWKILG